MNEWTPAIELEPLDDDSLHPVTIGDARIVVLRRGATVYALGDRCTHGGCLLHEGTRERDQIACACHGSRFTLDGAVVAGPATVPQPVLDTRTREGWVEVRRAGDSR